MTVLTIVLMELTLGIRTLILFEGSRRELTIDLLILCEGVNSTLTLCGCYLEYFKEFGAIPATLGYLSYLLNNYVIVFRVRFLISMI